MKKKMSLCSENESSVSDIKDLTIKIQNCFLHNGPNNLKWTLLNEFKMKYLISRRFSNAVVMSYQTVISTLLDSLKFNSFSNASEEDLFDEIFLQGVQHEAFLLLVNGLNKNDRYADEKILKLLQKFIRGSSIDTLMKFQCISQKDWDLKFVSKSNVWDNLITALVSLPERVANKTKGQFVKLFSPVTYSNLLLLSVFKTLAYIHDCLQNGQDCSVEFLAKLVGRLCMVGNADIVSKKYAKELITLSESDFIWRRISKTLITKLPPNSFDSFITNLLLVIPWYGYVEWILGDEGIKNEKINYLITTKLLFGRTFNQDILLQNIIGYFASSTDRLPCFYKIMDLLLESWMDKRSLQFQNSEQKLYLSAALMVCAGWLGKIKHECDAKVYINKILQGTQIRLESTDEAVRSQGMIVAENFIKKISPDAPTLKFEFTDKTMLNYLKNLMKISDRPDEIFLNEADSTCFEEIESGLHKDDTKPCESQTSTSKIEMLDSDDELEAYDMPQEINTSMKRPLYLRDCMKGLIEQEDAEYTEQCLLHAEELIKKNPYAAKEIAEEMSKIMLHLDNKFAFENFVPLRHRIMITLTVESPVLVSNYLISQFCARDYNIRQRLDILEVLASSSMALSFPNTFLDTQLCHSTTDPVSKQQAEWKLITQERIEAKTKRFAKASPKVLIENKFSSIAGLFFFPLLNNYKKKGSHFDVSKDNYVFSRFIFTLGMIMYAATNTAHCSEMGTKFLQFLSTVRNHSDVSVRQSVLFAVAATYMSVPFSVLFSEMISEVVDTNDWLQSVVEKDHESSCIERAIYTLSLLQSKATEESPTLPYGNLVIPGS